ncbi:sulfite exporter TauE/SafE family protein [Aestuariibacter halophilus]|uniref:Probable membrane transporter protein n=1 Tax=Fluctibacter halophilus TaxID=226011 RepID=A0ABS8GBC2_9ALTE|nr:sulfite exporter TauE/SafE family protein [Aestuariibacter halophilus]MCC2617870.1 sulfite exporter TauE/SafE family protein [Aestuariibacter halophilus]
MSELILGLVACLTSLLAAVVGLGGGMLLIAVMPAFFPAQVIIPLHAAIQWVSNGSRVLFAVPDVQPRLLPPFVIGSVLGIGVGWLFVQQLSADGIPFLIGLYILAMQWWPGFIRTLQRVNNLYVAGFVQTGLGLVVGATGPLTLALLQHRLIQRDAVIANNALLMWLTHGIKLGLFVVIGFDFLHWWIPLLAMALGAIVGSWAGTRLRQHVPQRVFKRVLSGLLTAMALYLVTTHFYKLVVS